MAALSWIRHIARGTKPGRGKSYRNSASGRRPATSPTSSTTQTAAWSTRPECRTNRTSTRLSGGPKRIESVAEKIDSGRYRRWVDIDDLFACTVVIPTLRDEDRVIAFLKGVFHAVDVRGRNDTRKPPAVFRFEATRFIGRLH